MSDSSLVLVDGTSYLYRAYHALPPLSTKDGQPTGAIHGVVNMIKAHLLDDPDHLVVVFDPKGPTLRHTWYADYKANRPPMPDELRIQLEPLYGMIKALGLPVIVEEGVEADDVIGTLATRATKQGWRVVISTGDKDMAQLVNDQVSLINTMTGKMLDAQGVMAKFGVQPTQIIDYLALMGDTVDHVPGIPGVGPKTAAKWLSQYHTLENLQAHAGDIRGKIGEKLRSHLEQLPLTKKLVTIICDVALSLELSDLKRKPMDFTTLKTWCDELEMKRMLQSFQEMMGSPTAVDTESENTQIDQKYELVNTQEAWRKWHDMLMKSPCFALDTETTSLDVSLADLVGMSFAIDDQACYVPFAHVQMDVPQLDFDALRQDLIALLSDPSKTVIGQNIKYDELVLKRAGIDINCQKHDTMLMSYVLDSTARHDMDSLAERYLNRKTISYQEVVGSGTKAVLFSNVDIESATQYAAEDAQVTFLLYEVLLEKLENDPNLKKVYFQLERPLISILSNMEWHGMLLDAEKLKSQSDALEGQILRLEQEVFKAAGKNFNLHSPKQLQQVLYDEMQLPILKKTPKGQPSTAEAVLQDLAFEYPVVQSILHFRHLAKLKSTYTDTLPQQVGADGRIRTSFNQAVTATGRLSSNKPNLQNIPIRTDEGRKIRQAFIAKNGASLVAADYSQIELRLMAHASKDGSLIQAFHQGLDIHQHTASEIFAIEPEKVDFEKRRYAKIINFGLMYGMSEYGLAKQLNVSHADAKAYIQEYFSRYPGVQQYMKDTQKQAEKNGYVETLWSRRLYLPDIGSSNHARKQAAIRAAINAPLQGSAADIIKLAMMAVDNWIENTNINATMLLQVHDELVFEVADEDVTAFMQGVVKPMTEVANLLVPLEVSVGSGAHWDAAH